MMKRMVLMFLFTMIFTASWAIKVQAAEKQITLGFMGDFTAVLSVHGVASKQGAILALEQANYTAAGRKIKLQVEDEASDPAVALDKARKLVETDKAAMILGPIHGGCAGAVSQYVNRCKVPQLLFWYPIASDAQAKAKWSWVSFGVLSSVPFAMGAYSYEKLGYRSVTSMATDYIAGREFIRGFEDSFTERGGKIVQKQWIPMGTKDISPYITVLKNADALLSWYVGLTMIAGFRQIKEYNVQMPVIMPQSGHSSSPEIMNSMGDDIIGVITPDAYTWTVDTPMSKAFLEDYTKRWGELPAGISYGGYLTTQIALAALEKTAGDTSPDALAKALDTTEIPAYKGNFTYSDARVGIIPCVIYKHVKLDDKIVSDVLATCTVRTDPAGDTLVHKILDKSW